MLQASVTTGLLSPPSAKWCFILSNFFPKQLFWVEFLAYWLQLACFSLAVDSAIPVKGSHLWFISHLMHLYFLCFLSAQRVYKILCVLACRIHLSIGENKSVMKIIVLSVCAEKLLEPVAKFGVGFCRCQRNWCFQVWGGAEGASIELKLCVRIRAAVGSVPALWAVAIQGALSVQSWSVWSMCSICVKVHGALCLGVSHGCLSSPRCLKASLDIIRMVERKWKRGKTDLLNISAGLCQITFWDSFLF